MCIRDSSNTFCVYIQTSFTGSKPPGGKYQRHDTSDTGDGQYSFFTPFLFGNHSIHMSLMFISVLVKRSGNRFCYINNLSPEKPMHDNVRNMPVSGILVSKE